MVTLLQATPALLDGVAKAIRAGGLGVNVCGGEFFLMRRDTLLVMIQVRGIWLEGVELKGVRSVERMQLLDAGCHSDTANVLYARAIRVALVNACVSSLYAYASGGCAFAEEYTTHAFYCTQRN